MATSRGRSGVDAYFASAPGKLSNVLRGAGRAGAGVIADEIKVLTPSEEVRAAVRIRTKSDEGRIVVRIDVKPGWARSLGTWLEYGTSGHFISVDDSQREGRGIRRINQQVRDADGNASLVIGGQFVGKTVWHPGARPHPAFRPALDAKERDAIAAAQAYINARVGRGGINPSPEGDGL